MLCSNATEYFWVSILDVWLDIFFKTNVEKKVFEVGVDVEIEIEVEKQYFFFRPPPKNISCFDHAATFKLDVFKDLSLKHLNFCGFLNQEIYI